MITSQVQESFEVDFDVDQDEVDDDDDDDEGAVWSGASGGCGIY